MVKLVSSDIDDNNDVDIAIDDEEDDDDDEDDDGETCACDIEHCGDDSVELGDGAGHVVSSGILLLSFNTYVPSSIRTSICDVSSSSSNGSSASYGLCAVIFLLVVVVLVVVLVFVVVLVVDVVVVVVVAVELLLNIGSHVLLHILS